MPQFTAPNFDKVAAYESEIRPAMMQIYALCKRHGVPFVFSFMIKCAPDANGADSEFATGVCSRDHQGGQYVPPQFENAVGVLTSNAHSIEVKISPVPKAGPPPRDTFLSA